MTAVRSEKLIQPNAQDHYEVTAADLPLSCPMPGMQLWNSHPRVYLPVEKTGWAKCPYCSAEGGRLLRLPPRRRRGATDP